MKIILHIGLEKAGSTSIQRYGADFSASLARAGVAWPDDIGGPAMTDLAVIVRDLSIDDPLTRAQGVRAESDRAAVARRVDRRIRRRVRRTGARMIALSCEVLSNKLTQPAEVTRLREFLLRFTDDIRIVGYIRPQDDYLVSLFTTSLYGRDGAFRPDAGYAGPMDLMKEAHRFDYDRIFSLWGDVFGDEAVSIGVNAGKGFDTVAHFADLIGGPDPGAARPIRANRALSPAQAQLMMHVNRLEQDGQVADAAYVELVQAFIAAASGGGVGLDIASRQQIRAQWDASNERLRRRFVPDLPAPLFPEAAKDDAAAPASAEEVGAAAARIIADLATRGVGREAALRRHLRFLPDRFLDRVVRFVTSPQA